MSAKASRICHTPPLVAVSESDWISKDGEFDSELARFNTFAEIDHETISTAPARIQFRATIGRQRNAIRMTLCWRADSGQILCAYCDIILLLLNQKWVLFTSESITQCAGYPLW